MGRHILPELLAATLILGAFAAVMCPGTAAAQRPQDPHVFDQRMSARIDSVQFRIKHLQDELEEGHERSSDYDSNSGIARQLEALDEQCRELERELNSGVTSMGSANDIYRHQQQIEYYISGLERQLQQIRRWMQPQREEDDSSETPPPGPETEEDGITDEDWAAEWAKGGT